MKITTHLDYISHCKTASGTNWSCRWTYRVFGREPPVFVHGAGLARGASAVLSVPRLDRAAQVSARAHMQTLIIYKLDLYQN